MLSSSAYDTIIHVQQYHVTSTEHKNIILNIDSALFISHPNVSPLLRAKLWELLTLNMQVRKNPPEMSVE